MAEVVSAERVKGTDKLLLLQLSVGEKEVQVTAGIAEQYAPGELIGKKLVLVYNLEPLTIKRIESQGMILAASHGKHISLLMPDGDVPSGSKVS